MSHPHFTLDLERCTGCEACVIACTNENEVGDGLAWRTVTTFNEPRHPAIGVLHYSLACNHCGVPVCLEKCPANAFSRDSRSGVVVHHAERCLGCRYCAWVCPYEAPKLNRATGTMEKCTFCSHRLQQGRDPACVTACPVGALGLGHGGGSPGEARPGLPDTGLDPSLNIEGRRSGLRPPLMTVDHRQGAVSPRAEQSFGHTLAAEWPLFVFSAVATFLVAWFSASVSSARDAHPGVLTLVGLLSLMVSALHLGRGLRAWRGILNVRGSWISREVAAYSAFLTATGALTLSDAMPQWLVWAGAAAGFSALSCMDMVYRVRGQEVRAVPHSAMSTLTAALYTALLVDLPLVVVATAAVKLALYLAGGRSHAGVARSVIVMRCTGLAAACLVIMPTQREYSWLLLTVVVVGELIDRAEFYAELDFLDPAKQVDRDLKALVGSASMVAVVLLTNPCQAAVPEHPRVSVRPEAEWVDVAEVESAVGQQGGEAARAAVSFLLVDRQTLIDGTRTSRYSRMVSRVDTQAGLETAAQREITFDPEFSTVEIHHLLVLREGTWLDRLDDAFSTMAQREADFSRRLYDGSLSVLLVMRDVQIGDVISFAYTIRGTNPVFDGRHLESFSMGWSQPVARRRVRVLCPRDQELYFRSYGDSAAPPVIKDGRSMTVYLWDQRGLPPYASEDGTPESFDSYPWLQVSQYASWADVVQWAQPLYASAGMPSSAVAEATKEVLTKIDEPADRALAVIRSVQDGLRYFGIMLGPNSHAPHTPTETLRRRFGDCKDKSLLLVSMLRAAGFEAWPALTHTTVGEILPTRHPSPGVFDHVIVLARVQDRDVWIDPTLALQGGDLWSLYCPDFTHALVVREDEADLRAISGHHSDPGSVQVSYDYVFDDAGDTCDVAIRTDFEGCEADDIRQRLADSTLDELQDLYLRYYSGSSGVVAPIRDLQVEDDRGANTVTTLEHYQLRDWWIADDKEEFFELLPLMVGEVLGTVDNMVRTSPLAVPRRLQRSETVTVRAPRGWRLAAVEHRDENPWFRYEVTSRGGGRRIELRYVLETSNTDVPAADIVQYNAAVEAVVDSASYMLTRPLHGSTSGSMIQVLTVVAAMLLILAGLVVAGTIGWALGRWQARGRGSASR